MLHDAYSFFSSSKSLRLNWSLVRFKCPLLLSSDVGVSLPSSSISGPGRKHLRSIIVCEPVHASRVDWLDLGTWQRRSVTVFVVKHLRPAQRVSTNVQPDTKKNESDAQDVTLAFAGEYEAAAVRVVQHRVGQSLKQQSSQ